MNVRIAKLEATLLRGLDMRKQQPEHDARFCELLAEYEALVDEQRQTCTRHDRVGDDLAWGDAAAWAEGQAALVEQQQEDWRHAQARLGGMR